MNIVTLYGQVVEKLPKERKEVVEAFIAEFAPGETMKLVLALTAAASRHERQMLRLMMTDIEKREVRGSGENE